MNKEHQLERLSSISEIEWRSILEKLANYVGKKLNGHIKYGAHSQATLGENPVGYYVRESILKLYECEWEWRLEYDILEQLERVVGSMISENVRKYRLHGNKISYSDNEAHLASIAGCDEESPKQDFENLVMKAATGDDELELYALAVFDCSSFNEIISTLGIEKSRAYYLQKKLKRRIDSILNAEMVLS